MISLPGMPIGKHALPVYLAMLILLLTVAFTTACGGGGSLTGGGCYTSTAMIPYGPSGTGSDPHVNWPRCPQMDLSIRSRGGP